MGDTLTQSRKLSSTDKQEVKRLVTGALFFTKLLSISAGNLALDFNVCDPIKKGAKELRKSLYEFTASIQECTSKNTDEWLEKKFDSQSLLQSLPTLLTTVAKLKPGTPEMIYSGVTELFHKLVGFRGKGKLLNYEKYKLLIDFIGQEMDAELSGGETALAVEDGSLVFKLTQQKSNFKEEVSI